MSGFFQQWERQPALSHLRYTEIMNSQSQPRVVIIGCGFGGLEAAKALAGKPVQVTLLDRCNHHLFQPLLYQVATAGLSAPSIAAPIRHIFRRQKNIMALMGEVSGIDTAQRSVAVEGLGPIGYDHLIVAAGATHSYFGNDAWAAHAPGLKTLEDAFEIRRRILLAFEHYGRERTPRVAHLCGDRRGRHRRRTRGHPG
jgi:NADH dehydrogenase